MNEEQNGGRKKTVARKLIPIAVTMAAILVALALPVLSWFIASKHLLAYAPITSPEALYIGAGHRDAEKGTFEDIRYLYFNGINAAEDHSDYVFCVYGTAISAFHLQLAFTTNNQFEYEIYVAKEGTVPWEGEGVENVKYVAHDAKSTPYYYTIDTSVNGGQPISGGFLNRMIDTDGKAVADGSRHSAAYGDYNNVNRFAEAIYWQTDSNHPIVGNSVTDFVVYFILRVNTNHKPSNDRETDVLCISAKSTTVN